MACARGFSALDQQPVAPRQLKDLRPATRQTPTWRCRVVIRCHCDSPLEASVRGTTFQSFSHPFPLDVILSPHIMRARTQQLTNQQHTFTQQQPIEFCAQQCTRISESKTAHITSTHEPNASTSRGPGSSPVARGRHELVQRQQRDGSLLRRCVLLRRHSNKRAGSLRQRLQASKLRGTRRDTRQRSSKSESGPSKWAGLSTADAMGNAGRRRDKSTPQRTCR